MASGNFSSGATVVQIICNACNKTWFFSAYDNQDAAREIWVMRCHPRCGGSSFSRLASRFFGRAR